MSKDPRTGQPTGDHEAVTQKTHAIKKMREELDKAEAKLGPDQVAAVLLPLIPALFQTLAERALGLFQGEYATRAGKVIKYRLDPDVRSASLILDRALGSVPKELALKNPDNMRFMLVLAGLAPPETIAGLVPTVFLEDGKEK